MSVASCLILLCFSFSLDLLFDEPLFLLKLPGSLLSQTGNLVGNRHVRYGDVHRETHSGFEELQIMHHYSSLGTDVVHHLYGFHILKHPFCFSVFPGEYAGHLISLVKAVTPQDETENETVPPTGHRLLTSLGICMH